MSFFIWQSLFFLLTQLFGLGVALKAQGLFPVEQISTPKLEPWRFLVIFGVLTGLMILMMRLPRGKGLIFRAVFILTVWWGSALALSVWMHDTIALVISIAAITLWLFWAKVFLHNALVILGIAGVGSVFGLRFSPESIVALLILFAVYDVIAVYKTKHMIKLARTMLEVRAIFAVIAPSKISLFFSGMRDVPSDKGPVLPSSRAGAEGSLPKEYMMLGGGDIAFPLMLASSVSVHSPANAFIVIGFSFFGLIASFVLFFLLGRKPMPALPPIAVFSILGFFFTKLIEPTFI